jgi:hypothetical protein
MIIQGVGEHPNQAIVESHDPRAHQIHCKRVKSSDDETRWTRITSHRAIALAGHDTVHHAEVSALWLIVQDPRAIPKAKRPVQIQNHSPRGVVAVPVPGSYAICGGVSENSPPDPLYRTCQMPTKRSQLRKVSLEGGQQDMFETFGEPGFSVLVAAG